MFLTNLWLLTSNICKTELDVFLYFNTPVLIFIWIDPCTLMSERDRKKGEITSMLSTNGYKRELAKAKLSKHVSSVPFALTTLQSVGPKQFNNTPSTPRALVIMI